MSMTLEEKRNVLLLQQENLALKHAMVGKDLQEIDSQIEKMKVKEEMERKAAQAAESDKHE